MKTVRTSDDAFEALADIGYDFAPNYAIVKDPDGDNPENLRMHYLDEGPGDGPVVLLMHGEPSWSFLYRFMIPELVAAGMRCIAPDLIGFGKSDKPTEMSDYTYARHVEWVRELVIDHLELGEITLFGQDWGGLVGLRLGAEHPELFRAIVVGNTGLPTGEGRMSEAFLAWQKFSQESPVLPIGNLVQSATVRELTEAEVAAYEAPFPDDSFKAGARIFPSLVPTSTDDPAAAANQAAFGVLSALSIPFITCFSDSDPVTAGGDAVFKRFAGAKDMPHVTIEGGGHFFQEDKPNELVAVILSALARS